MNKTTAIFCFIYAKSHFLWNQFNFHCSTCCITHMHTISFRSLTLFKQQPQSCHFITTCFQFKLLYTSLPYHFFSVCANYSHSPVFHGTILTIRFVFSSFFAFFSSFLLRNSSILHARADNHLFLSTFSPFFSLFFFHLISFQSQCRFVYFSLRLKCASKCEGKGWAPLIDRFALPPILFIFVFVFVLLSFFLFIPSFFSWVHRLVIGLVLLPGNFPLLPFFSFFLKSFAR